MSDIKIWGAGTPRSFRPVWMAEELGVQYAHHPIGPRTGETRTSEYTKMNRKQKIPFLSDSSVRLSESLAICRYLAAAYPNDSVFLPSTLQDRAKEDEWCCYIFGEMDESSLYVMRRHSDLADEYGSSEEVVKSAGQYLQRHLKVLEQHLDGREYLMDQGFSLPDIMLVSCLDWALFYGLVLPSVLNNYRDRIAERPAYGKAMQVNYAEFFGGLSNGTA